MPFMTSPWSLQYGIHEVKKWNQEGTRKFQIFLTTNIWQPEWLCLGGLWCIKSAHRTTQELHFPSEVFLPLWNCSTAGLKVCFTASAWNSLWECWFIATPCEVIDTNNLDGEVFGAGPNESVARRCVLTCHLGCLNDHCPLWATSCKAGFVIQSCWSSYTVWRGALGMNE